MPSTFHPGGSGMTQYPLVHHTIAPRSTVSVASVTMMEGTRRYATSAPFSAPIPRPSRRLASTTRGIGTPARASVPVIRAHTASIEPTEMSIWPATITMVIPIPTTAT